LGEYTLSIPPGTYKVHGEQWNRFYIGKKDTKVYSNNWNDYPAWNNRLIRMITFPVDTTHPFNFTIDMTCHPSAFTNPYRNRPPWPEDNGNVQIPEDNLRKQIINPNLKKK
jgi:hypothetical protein